MMVAAMCHVLDLMRQRKWLVVDDQDPKEAKKSEHAQAYQVRWWWWWCPWVWGWGGSSDSGGKSWAGEGDENAMVTVSMSPWDSSVTMMSEVFTTLEPI